MADLLEDRGALFSVDEKRRLKLWRIWDKAKPLLITVLTNPSIACGEKNDPTVERVVRRAIRLGYGGVIMVNMLDTIETDSRKLDQIPSCELNSLQNTNHLIDALNLAADGKADILCGWGKPGQKYGPVAWFTTQAARRKVTLFCLRKNKDGSPEHPLYIPYSEQMKWFAGVDKRDAAEPLAA